MLVFSIAHAYRTLRVIHIWNLVVNDPPAMLNHHLEIINEMKRATILFVVYLLERNTRFIVQFLRGGS